MKTEFCQYLYDMQKIADDSNITVEARHFDVLDFYFKSKLSPLQAFKEYAKFLPRIYALDEEVSPIKPQLKPLTEMSGDHFSQIFMEGFAPSFMKENILEFKSLYGFHNAIAKYGKFESHRLAVELGYDVEFTLAS